MGVLPRQLKPWMILGGTVTLLLIGLIAGAAMLLAALKVMTYVSRKRSVSKTIKSLKGSGYNQHDDLDEAEIHPATNSIAWDFGNLIARFYYFPGKKAGSSMRLFHITENGSRELVDPNKLHEWLDALRLKTADARRELVKSSLDN